MGPVAESVLYVGDVVVRREDAAHTRVCEIEPFVRDMRVTQILNSLSLAATLLWSAKCLSVVVVGFCQTAGRVAHEAVVH